MVEAGRDARERQDFLADLDTEEAGQLACADGWPARPPFLELAAPHVPRAQPVCECPRAQPVCECEWLSHLRVMRRCRRR